MLRSVRIWTLIPAILVAVALGCAAQTQEGQPAAAPVPAAPAPAVPQAPAGAPQVGQQPAAPLPAAPAAPAQSAAPAPAFIQAGAIPTRVARAPAPATAKGPSGTLVVAEPNLSFPGTVPSKVSCTTQDMNHRYGVYETPKYWDITDPVIVPNLATAWAYNDTATVLTFNLKEGVQFHGGWGEMTAEDWKWSHDNMVIDGSIHSNIFISKARVQEIEVVDPYTVRFNLDKPNIFFIDAQFNGPGGCGSFEIVSRKRVETLGSDEAHLDLSGGTGPFKWVKWEAGNELIVEAVPGHHRKDSEYATIRGVEISEQATSLAALMVGEVDIAVIPVTMSTVVEENGLDVRRMRGGGYQRLYPQGRFCMTETLDGTPVDPNPRPGYDPSQPWVGDCNDPVAQENARKVRVAVSMSIDRQSIVDNILGGFGRPAGPGELSAVTYDKYFQERWTVPYDPERARQLLAEAGYPDGFEATIRITTGSNPLEIEMGEAVGKYMEEIGIDVNLIVLTYSGNRPSVVARERSDWWFRSSGGGLGLNPEIAMIRRNPVGAFNPGFEVREPLEIIAQIDACTTPDCIDALREVQWDWWHDQQQIIGVVESFGTFAVDPNKVGIWTIPTGTAGVAGFEYIQKPR